MRSARQRRAWVGPSLLAGLISATLLVACATAPWTRAKPDSARPNSPRESWRQAVAWWPPPAIASRLAARVPAELSLSPPFECEVTGVDADLDLVLISAGADDAVEVGDRMTVHSDARFVGELEIEKVGPDWASGHMVPDETRRFPVEGDGVTTRW